MDYNVDYFLAKFSAIPKNKWACMSFVGMNGCCALGHCGVKRENISEGNIIDNDEGLALANLFMLLPFNKKWEHMQFRSVYSVNDQSCGSPYRQSHPKQRILAALMDIKKLQEAEAKKQVPEPIKEKVYVTVRVAESIFEGSDERVLN